jgi:hypothetical protein
MRRFHKGISVVGLERIRTVIGFIGIGPIPREENLGLLKGNP